MTEHLDVLNGRAFLNDKRVAELKPVKSVKVRLEGVKIFFEGISFLVDRDIKIFAVERDEELSGYVVGDRLILCGRQAEIEKISRNFTN